MLAFFPAKVIDSGDHFVFRRTNSQPWFLDFNFGGTEVFLRVGWPTVCLSLNEYFFPPVGVGPGGFYITFLEVVMCWVEWSGLGDRAALTHVDSKKDDGVGKHDKFGSGLSSCSHIKIYTFL